MRQENYKFGKYISNENDSRWADSEEIKKYRSVVKINLEADEYPGAGIPIISDGTTAYVDDSDTHTLIFGSTGSKKTRLFGMPLINILAMAGESFITTDPKGELFNKTSGLVEARGYKMIVLNFRDLKQSDCWNPLTLPYELYHSGKTDEAISLLNDLLTALAEPQRKGAKDPYWITMAYAHALASILFFIDTASAKEANFFNFANFFSSYSSPEETERIFKHIADSSIAAINYKSILTNKEAKSTFGNVSSGVSTMFSSFITQKTLGKVLSMSSFDIRNFGKTKTAVYLIVPDEKSTLHFLVTIFIKQIYEALIDIAHQLENKKLPVRVNFVLDEFANIPTIPDMTSMISAARSRNMRFFLFAQSLFQLKQKYKDDIYTIKGNCDNWVFLTSREYDLLAEISNLCGNRLYKDISGNIQSMPLISISDLQRFKKEYGETLILHGRNYPFVTELPDIDEYKFKEFPRVKTDERVLPQIVRYDAEKVIELIEAKKRPLPFSKEVHGKNLYYESSNEKKQSSSDIFDW
ncbi:MAG: type IV secretory system conjugative DNA transfer family protein [Defluviitaleaceae bacterium]|nr:type IV secretory system conjugative DNA transfer family protein [Defluviitaleaceae bacterium]